MLRLLPADWGANVQLHKQVPAGQIWWSHWPTIVLAFYGWRWRQWSAPLWGESQMLHCTLCAWALTVSRVMGRMPGMAMQ